MTLNSKFAISESSPVKSSQLCRPPQHQHYPDLHPPQRTGADREDRPGVTSHRADGRSSKGSPMIDLQGYDRTHSLSKGELHHMQMLVIWAQQGNKGWHKEARPALQRLLRPLEDVLDHLGAMKTVKRKYAIRTTVICPAHSRDGAIRREFLGIFSRSMA
jgi:hypothetical protein